jgi:hypothetical protein
MWRPALAMASVAAVIGLSVWYLNERGNGAEIAEVRPAPPAKNERTAPPSSTEVPAPSMPSTETAVSAPSGAGASVEASDELQKDMVGEVAAAATASEPMDMEVAEAPAEQAREDLALDVVPTATGDAAKPAAPHLLDTMFETRQLSSNSGYLNNWSMANATGATTGTVVVAKESRERAKRKAESETVADQMDDRTLALLRAAW